jgi:ubiquinol-cytochrome c reductase iron-sulfur subunit
VSHADSHGQDDPEKTRREFLYVATGAAGAVATGAAVWPLIDQMNPSRDVLALATVEVNVSGVEPGIEIKQMWQGKPVFIRHRTEEEIEAARGVDVSDLKDPVARNPNIPGEVPATDENRTVGDKPEWLVMIGICTHLGCIPLGDGAGDYNGWFCPCHGSHYDQSGRIRRGPAPENLPIPPATWVSDTTIRLG